MTEIEQMTLNAVAHISSQKALDKKAPLHAMLMEVLSMMQGYDQRQVVEALRGLTRAGKVIYGRAVNDFYFKINTDGTKQG